MYISDLAGGRDILSGAPMGRRLLASMLQHTVETSAPEVLFLDFHGVEAATASFLREGPLEYRRIVRGRKSPLYPVAANISDAVREDLELVLGFQSDAMFYCRLLADEVYTNVGILGKLEPKQEETYQELQRAGVVDAVSLASTHESRGIGATAWNNRLASLADKGIAMEFVRGRSKTYRLTLEAFQTHGR